MFVFSSENLMVFHHFFMIFLCFSLLFIKISKKNRKIIKTSLKKNINFQGPSNFFGKIGNLISPRGIYDLFMILFV